MSKKPPPRHSFSDDGENGARRKDVRYRLDGKGQGLKKPLDILQDVPLVPLTASSAPSSSRPPQAPPSPIIPKRRPTPVQDTAKLGKPNVGSKISQLLRM